MALNRIITLLDVFSLLLELTSKLQLLPLFFLHLLLPFKQQLYHQLLFTGGVRLLLFPALSFILLLYVLLLLFFAVLSFFLRLLFLVFVVQPAFLFPGALILLIRAFSSFRCISGHLVCGHLFVATLIVCIIRGCCTFCACSGTC